MKNLRGKNAIVTGGAKGIGKSVCLALANAGANIHILDINKDEGRETEKEIAKLNVEVSFYQIDVADENSWIEFSNFLKNKKILTDILVNNAGIWIGKDIDNVSLEEYQRLISINLTGVFLGIKYLVPFLTEAGKKTKFGKEFD